MITLFLPGAGGSASFWKPVADRTGLDAALFAWPGLGDEPAHPGVCGLDDLVNMVLARMVAPVNIVAQSMGGLVAIKAALAAPEMVNRLVLAAASGGVPVGGGCDWRPGYRRDYPGAAQWITEVAEDLSAQIPSIAAPALLLWGEADPISPVAVGERLRALLPHADLQVVRAAGHDLAQTHADLVAGLIKGHLTARPFDRRSRRQERTSTNRRLDAPRSDKG